MSAHLGRWQVAALRGLMDAERDMDAADVLVTEMGERLSLSETDDRLRRDAESLLRGSALGVLLMSAESTRVRRALDRAIGSLLARGLIECVDGHVRVSDRGAGVLAARGGVHAV